MGTTFVAVLILFFCFVIPASTSKSSDTTISFYFADMLNGYDNHNHHHSPSATPTPNPDLCEINCTREELLKSKIKYLYDNAIYPLNLPILTGQSTTLQTIFAPDAVGRFDPVGVFTGFDELKEYFYALGATPAVHAIAMDYISLFASGDEVFVRVNILFQSYAAGDNNTWIPKSQFNVTQLGRFLFNASDFVISLDTMLHNLAGIFDPVDEAGRQQVIYEICGVLEVNPGNCNSQNDPLGYYTDFNDCVTFMNTIPFGSWANAMSNTVVCRQLHSTLTIYDPEVHCPHAGKTGGGKCIDFTYASFFEKSY